MAENCALVFMRDEPAYTCAFSAPFERFSISAANLRHSTSRKSPWSPEPPGNWCEILSIVPDCAKALVPHSMRGTDAEVARKRRRDVDMAEGSSERIPKRRLRGAGSNLRDGHARVNGSGQLSIFTFASFTTLDQR